MRNRFGHSAILAVALTFTACSSTGGGAAAAKPPANRTVYRIETVFGDSVQGKTYTFVRNPPYDGVEYNAEFRILERFLLIEGMKEVDGTKMKPDFQVTYYTSRENPPTGISVGVILPYTHTVLLSGRRGGSIDWKIKVVGTSEEKALRHHLHRLLGAARHYFGQSTNGEQRTYLPDDDLKMLEVQGTAPMPAPSTSVRTEG